MDNLTDTDGITNFTKYIFELSFSLINRDILNPKNLFSNEFKSKIKTLMTKIAMVKQSFCMHSKN